MTGIDFTAPQRIHENVSFASIQLHHDINYLIELVSRVKHIYELLYLGFVQPAVAIAFSV